MGQPNELPEGGEGGGGFTVPGGIRGEWPAELPVGPDFGSILGALVSEITRLQVRLQALESAQLMQRVMGFGSTAMSPAAQFTGIGGPNEMPEGGEGGGGGIGGILGGLRGEWPQELPVSDIIREVEQRLSQVEQLITERFNAVASQIQKLGKSG